MTLLAYTLTPRARISAGKTGEVQESRSIHRVLPGSAIRGALGHTWWLSPTHAFDPKASTHVRQEAFDRLFGRALVVRDAVPAADGVQLRTASMAYLKYAGSADRSPEGHHDLAAGPLEACPACDARFAEPRGWSGTDTPRAGLPLDRCPSCGAVFELAKDGWHVPEQYEVAATRTALVDGVAENDKLFTRTALSKRLRFRGTLLLRDVPVPPEAIAWLQEVMEFNVGGQRSTLGRVGWSAESFDPDPLPTTEPVVLQLRSPAILVDERGFPTLDLVGYLASLPGAGSLACRPWLRTTQVYGWHGVAGVPKPVEWAVDAGSTAVLSGWSPDALARLTQGIGLRQLEGYGEVALKSPDDLARFGRPVVERLLKQPPADATAHARTPTTPSTPVAPAPAPANTPAAPPAPPDEPPEVSAPPAPIAPIDAAPTEAAAHVGVPTPGTTPAPPQTAPDVAPPADTRVTDLIALVPPEARARVLNGLLGQARSIATKRELGMPGSMIDTVIIATMSYPWARDLGPDARARVQELLRSPDVGDLVPQLEAERTKP